MRVALLICTAIAVYILTFAVHSHATGKGLFSENINEVRKAIKRGDNVNILDKHSNETPLISALVSDYIDRDHVEININIVKLLIESGADVNGKTSDGRTPLLTATYNFRNRLNLQAIELLIKHGADPNVESSGGAIPLSNAATCGDVRVVETLIKAGAEVNAGNSIGATALHSASNYPHIIKVLLNSGANVNTAQSQGYTPLHSAAQGLNRESVALLIAAGADINAKNQDGETPLMLAAKSQTKKPDVISLLVRAGADTQIKNKNGEMALDLAKKAKNPEFILRLIVNGGATSIAVPGKILPKMKVDPAIWEYAETEKILDAIKQGADVNDSTMPLYNILDNRTFDLTIFNALVRAGADVNIRDNRQSKSPMITAMVHRPSIVMHLIAAGADIEAKDVDGNTPLMVAASLGYIETLKILLDAGANVNAKNKYKETSLSRASREEVTRILQAHRATNATRSSGATQITTPRTFTGTENEARSQAFLKQVQTATPEAVQTALKEGIDLNVTDENGKTALMLAAQHNPSAQVISMLLKAGASLDVRDKWKIMPCYGHAAITRML